VPAGIGKALLAGASLGLWYDPFFAVLGAAAAAGLLGWRERVSPWRWAAASALLVAFWALGDGIRIALRAREAAASPLVNGEPWLNWLALGTWAFVGFVAGYVFPAAVGIAAGRMQRRGPGWPAAVAVAIAISLGFSVLLSLASRS